MNGLENEGTTNICMAWKTGALPISSSYSRGINNICKQHLIIVQTLAGELFLPVQPTMAQYVARYEPRSRGFTLQLY